MLLRLIGSMFFIIFGGIAFFATERFINFSKSSQPLNERLFEIPGSKGMVRFIGLIVFVVGIVLLLNALT